jgi:hypothetical protein
MSPHRHAKKLRHTFRRKVLRAWERSDRRALADLAHELAERRTQP